MKVTTENSRTILEAEQGAFITEAYPTYDRHFYTVKYLSSGEKPGDYRDADAAGKAAWEKKYPDGNVVPGRTAATPLFETAGAVFNDRTGYYGLNGITDITEKEMSLIYQNAGRGWGDLTLPEGIRTNIPPRTKSTGWDGYDQIRYNGTFNGHHSIEILRLSSDDNACVYADSIAYAFRRCIRLREIRGIIGLYPGVKTRTAEAFTACEVLEEVRVKWVEASISFKDCPRLSLASFEFMVDNVWDADSATVIYVHPAVMARLHGINRQEIDYNFAREETIIEGAHNTYHLDSEEYKVGDYTYVEGTHKGERVWSVGLIEACYPGADYPYLIRTLYAGKVAENPFDPTYFDRKDEWTALLDKAAEKNISFATT